MEAKLYYTPPTDEIFNNLKQEAIALWNTYENLGGYRDEKIGRIKELENVSDNFMYIFAMFDDKNQRIILCKVEEQTRYALIDRIIDGGGSLDYLNRGYGKL